MSEVATGVLGIVVVLAFFLTGIELGFAMAVVGLAGFTYIVTPQAALNLLAKDIWDVFSSYGFTVIPLFVLMGQIGFNAGIAKRLYETSYRFIGHIPGGLAMATVGGAAAFGAITGSSPATAATFASMAIPEMDRYGYNKKLSAGIVSAIGTLGSLIPPSVTLIVYGMITQQSIGNLFLAAILPGLIISFLIFLTVYGLCKIDPSLGPKGERSTWRERIVSLKDVIWVIVIFFVVIGGLTWGIFTPTEAGSVGTFAVLLLSVLKKDIGFKGLIKSFAESLRTACMVLVLIAGSTIFGHFLVVTKISMIAADWILGLPYPPFIIMIFILLIYEIGGSFIDDLAFMVLATPIFFPVVIKLGFDPIWFGVILHIFVMIGCLIPPVAINVFVVKNITKIPFGVIYAGVLPFLICYIICAALLFLFPEIALFLPSHLMR